MTSQVDSPDVKSQNIPTDRDRITRAGLREINVRLLANETRTFAITGAHVFVSRADLPFDLAVSGQSFEAKVNDAIDFETPFTELELTNNDALFPITVRLIAGFGAFRRETRIPSTSAVDTVTVNSTTSVSGILNSDRIRTYISNPASNTDSVYLFGPVASGGVEVAPGETFVEDSGIPVTVTTPAVGNVTVGRVEILL